MSYQNSLICFNDKSLGLMTHITYEFSQNKDYCNSNYILSLYTNIIQLTFCLSIRRSSISLSLLGMDMLVFLIFAVRSDVTSGNTFTVVVSLEVF